MKFGVGAAVAFVLAGATLSQAADSVTGRWAADEAACTRWYGPVAQSPLIVSENSLRWSSDACRVERTYKTGDTVHLQAMCWGDAGAKSVPVSLRLQGGRLMVSWDRAARGTLRRCP
jgi:hypothetical protein